MGILISRRNFLANCNNAVLFDSFETYVIDSLGDWKNPIREIVVESIVIHGSCEFIDYMVVYEIEASDMVIEVLDTYGDDGRTEIRIAHFPWVLTHEIMDAINFIFFYMDVDQARLVDLLTYGFYCEGN